MLYIYGCLIVILLISYFVNNNKAKHVTHEIKHRAKHGIYQTNNQHLETFTSNLSNPSNPSNPSIDVLAPRPKRTSNKLGVYFNKKDLKRFHRKYGEQAKTYKFKYGQVTITSSKYVEEIPQISWNGYFINNLLVYPKYRGNGYGQRLLKYIINHTRDRGALHLISQVDKTNISAIRTHESAGFGRHDDGYTSDGREVIIFIYNL